jgi:glycosidase
MYVIMDIVLNHAGDVFAYRGYGSEAPPSDHEYEIGWRDERGNPVWSTMPIDETIPGNAAVFPDELRKNVVFRRKGRGGENGGDFCSLKEMVTEKEETFPWRHFPVRDVLIRAYQYWIAKTDIDGYRIDTLKYIKPEFARIFGNAMREYALSIGKKNFFAFGEVFDDEEKIRMFIGKDSSQPGQPVGVDSALDFPLFFNLPSMIKGMAPPSNIVGMYQHRLETQKGLLSSHGEAGQFFVTFLDNHDMRSRFYYQDPADIHKYDAQVSMGIACLFSLQGIPCLYYGTEQGLHGSGDIDSFVREALWGKSPEFDCNHPFYQTIKEITCLRDSQPALRYGRQYFRPISGNGMDFGISTFQQGILAFSRILNDTEIVVALNTHTSESRQVEIIVDFALNPVTPTPTSYQVLFSNKGSGATTTVMERYGGTVTIHETNGGTTNGPIKTLPVSLQPMEVKILGKMG